MNRREVLVSAGLATGTALIPSFALAASARFEGDLVLKVGPDARIMQLTSPYTFIDASGKRWSVPAGVQIDGASIPQAFWSIIGGPFEGAYRNASVIHDYYCDVRTEPWQAVHRMFHEGMLANGVQPVKAKIMYLAVYYGGPRWSEVVIRNMRIQQQSGAKSKGGPEGVKDLGKLQRVQTSLGVDIAVPQRSTAPGGSESDYVISMVERPKVDIYTFKELADKAERQGLSLDQIDDLVEAKRTGSA